MNKISPSILAADFSRLGEEISLVEKAGADYIHVDVMDGHFVPNITIGPLVVKALRKTTKLPLDVHLMITDPEKYIPDFAKAGSDIITIHAESTPHIHRAIQMIKEEGKKAGVSINPGTPVFNLEEIILDVDLILIMSVNPGFGGQQFIENTLDKISITRELLNKAGSDADLEVDGGIKIDNIKRVSDAGANVFVAGSAIFGSDDYEKTIKEMKNKLDG